MMWFSSLRTKVAIVLSAIVAAFFSGRIIGWRKGKVQALKKVKIAAEKRKNEVEKESKKIDAKVNGLSRSKLGKWLHPPRNR